MRYIATTDYDQLHLFPPTLEELLAPDHPARFIREFVEVVMEQGDLELHWGTGEVGAPPYPPEVLLRIWLYGYYERVRSSRALEAACKERLGFLWLAGMVQPDHNTLWRFFKQNKTALRTLFTHTLKAALKAKCIGFVLHALDGTRIQSCCATRTGWHAVDLEKRIAQLEERITTLEQEIEEAGQHKGAPDDSLPESLHNARNLRAQLQSAYDELKSLGLKNHQPKEPDAKLMKCQDRGKTVFGYNGQAVADEKSGLIVAQDVVNEANDTQQLVPMMEKVRENLGVTAELTATDKGYTTGTALREAKEKHLPVCTHLLKHFADRGDAAPYHSSQFTYDAEGDTVICPRGEHLTYEKERSHKNRGYTVRVFRCHCTDCPVRDQCTQEKRGRVIELAPYHEALSEQRALQKTDTGRQALRKRGHIIETVFAHIKEHGRFRRWTLRGIEAVRTQWSLICTAHNLRKLYALWRANLPNTGPANAMRRPESATSQHPWRLQAA